LGPCGRTSIYKEKPSRGRKPVVQPLWPGYYAHGRSPLRACRRLNHCFHLSGGELAIENIKMKKKKEGNLGKEKERGRGRKGVYFRYIHIGELHPKIQASKNLYFP
jgi:hypothetical protein